jgi:integrase
LKNVFDHAVRQGLVLTNPASHIKRRRIIPAIITVPSRVEFQNMVAAIRASDGRPDSQRKAKAGADLVELLAYSGCRVAEATALRWADVNLDRNYVTITGGDKLTRNYESRTIPMTDALRDLLLRLRSENQPQPQDFVSPIKTAKKCLQTACRRLGFPRFTHHDLRHFFATTCIESGGDIPTISKWLGHRDGGALAMKVYGHLRQEHSFAQIKRVQFGAEQPANIVPLANTATA